ncbi:pleckstrin homology domain-containing family M member 2-like [Diadema setosum]|uniref:pleckstrin homology domain-containing family M member 2-like n=1 Tax=Diadema setosum TaxID=31175 RepID=UPI003B3B3638
MIEVMASQRVKLKDQILDGIARSVKEVQAYAFSSDGEVVKIGNEARPLQRLVEHLDHAFLHGLKQITPGYWVFVKRFTHRLLISDIKALDRLATDLGRSRAWLYQSLNEGALESYLRCFLSSDDILRKFYIEHALLRDSERLTLLMTLVSGLDFVTFDLELNVAYFDLVSHVPRSASDPRDLDDTVSIHSNMSVESASSSVYNDRERSASLGGESWTWPEGSPREPQTQRPILEESSDVRPGTDAGSGDVDKDKTEAVEGCVEDTKPDDEAVILTSTDLDTPPSVESKDSEESQEVTRPLTLDIMTQSNNNSSNELKHVARNYSTPDFDINMEKVAEQDQNLEVIRIRKKGKKKKKKRAGSKGSGTGAKDLKCPGQHTRDRSSSPSTVSIASSCIEETELEEKDALLGVDGRRGSLSSATNVSECSAVESEADARSVLASSLPESENHPPESIHDEVQEDGKLGELANESRESLGEKQKEAMTDCSIVICSILDKVCEMCEAIDKDYSQEEGVEIVQDTKHDDVKAAVDQRLKIPSLADSFQDSFNSSVEVIDKSSIYWQGEFTDNSFDADIPSSTPGKARVLRLNVEEQSELLDDDVFAKPDTDARNLENRISSSPRVSEGGDLRMDVESSNKGKKLQRTVSSSLEYDTTISVPLRTVHTAPANGLPQNLNSSVPSTESDSPLSPVTSDHSFMQSDMSVGIPTCSSDSLSSGVGSGPDSTTPNSGVLSLDLETSNGCVTTGRKDKSWQQSSGVSFSHSLDDDEDGFVIIDVMKDGEKEEDKEMVEEEEEEEEETERIGGDGRDASQDPLRALDINLNQHQNQSDGVTVATDEVDFSEKESEVTAHDAEMKVDNNLKLYLMLEIFKIEDEKFHKLLRLSSGHMEGNLIPAFILLTDLAIYILRRGERNGRFTTESRVMYKELDYVLIGLNYQSILLVCKYRRRQFWLTTASEDLTRFFLHCVKSVMKSSQIPGPLCELTDPTAQAIGLKKFVASEEKTEMSDVRVHLYSLVHWEDLVDSSTAADMQLYLPPTKVKGMLHYKTRESFFVGSYWKVAYFKLKNNIFRRYGRRLDDEPELVIELSSHKFGGCRRVHHSDRKFCFELVFTDGTPSLQLACENELQMSHWLQNICEVVAQQHAVSQRRGSPVNPCQPSCAVITSRSLILCLEDYQTHFFRTLARTSLASIAFVETSPTKHSYVSLNFHNAECDNPWLLYFNSLKEQDKFVRSLSEAFQEQTTKHLKTNTLQDDKLKKRCGNCQELIMSSWQRSDSLERGRVRGDSW